MQAIQGISKETYAWLQKVPVEARSRHVFDGMIRNDHITNNMTESFNNWLGISRSKPILTMLETIRCKLIGKFQMRYQKALQWQSNVTLNIKKKLDKTLYKSRKCKVEYAGEHEYDIRDSEGVRHIVHVSQMSCSCREWEISGIPCTYAMAAISRSRMNVENFVHPYYSKQKYLMANSGIIHPISDHTMWTLIDEEPLQPPPLKRLVERPKNSRKRASHEPPVGTSQAKRSFSLKCSRCKEFGHNKRTCQKGPARGGKGGIISSGRGKDRVFLAMFISSTLLYHRKYSREERTRFPNHPWLQVDLHDDFGHDRTKINKCNA
ncbi:hypothetical protein ACSBR1_031265 [Camellia fascicularis]